MDDKQPTLLEFLSGESAKTAEPAAETKSAREYLSCDNVKDFCKGILQSREYRQSLLDRIILGDLAPQIETRLYDYAYGKPVERVEFKDTSDPVDEFTVEQCLERIEQLKEIARQLQQRDDDARTELVH